MNYIYTKTIKCKLCNEKFHIHNEIEWKKNKFQCQLCKINYCILPKSERELRILQDLYLQNREEKYVRKMFYILTDYIQSIIKKKYAHVIKFLDGEIENVSKEVAALVIKQYCKKEFIIETSFCGYFEFKIKEVLYPQKTKKILDNCDSLDYEFEDGNQPEFEDNKYSIDLLLAIEEKMNICKEILILIKMIKSECHSKKEDYIRLLNVANFLDNRQNYIQNFFDIYEKSTGKLITIKTIAFLKKELQTRC
jgi:hypothetical protein